MAYDLSQFSQIEAAKLVSDLESDPGLFTRYNYFLLIEIQPGIPGLIPVVSIERTETGNCAVHLLFDRHDMIEGDRAVYYTSKEVWL